MPAGSGLFWKGLAWYLFLCVLKNMLSAVNLSNYTWIISDGGNRKACAPGGRVVLKKGLVITVLKRQLQLTVAEIK